MLLTGIELLCKYINKLTMNHLPENLRILRAWKKLSARELSMELNLMSENRIGDIENGQRTVRVKDDELEQIAKYFNITVEQLTQCQADIVFIKKT